MKNIFILLALVFSLQSGYIHAQSKSNSEKNRIILVNPGEFYLKSLVLLTEKGIIDIENIEYQAVFYSKSEVSYDKAEQYVKDNNINYISFLKVDGELTPKNIYEKNMCSDSFKNLFDNSDGIIFLGGWDIPPTTYNQKTNLHTQIRTPNRHYFELSFLYHLLGSNNNFKAKPLLASNTDYVVFGICLGMQSMSVATGGTMYQDIPSEVYGANFAEDVLALEKNQQHRSYWRNIDRDKALSSHSFHQIKIKDNSVFTKNFNLENNNTPYVCSSHHQAINKLGDGFDIVATSMDEKIIEAIQHKKYKNVLGVQFHPEFYYLHDADSKKFKLDSNDEKLRTEYEIINELGGYKFNLEYWRYFSNLF